MPIPTLLTSDPDFQYVLLPVAHIPAVHELLAELGGQSAVESTSRVAPQPASDPNSAFAGWSQDEVVRLARGEKKTTVIVGEIMDHLANLSVADDEQVWLTNDQLATATGRTASQLRVVWSKLAQHRNSQYSSTGLPVSAQWGNEFTPPIKPQVVYYSLTVAAAQAWKAIREG